MRRTLATTSLLALCLSIPNIAAALTVEEAWAKWQTGLDTMGAQTETLTPSLDGDTLIIPDVIVDAPLEEGITTKVTLQGLTFTPKGDDVEVRAKNLAIRSSAGETADINLTDSVMMMKNAQYPGLAGMNALNWTGNITGTLSVPDTTDAYAGTITINDISLDMPEGNADASGTMTFTHGALSLFLGPENPENPSALPRVETTIANGSTEFSVSDVSIFTAEDPFVLLQNGFTSTLNTNQGTGSYSVTLPGGPEEASASWETTQGTIAIGPEGLRHDFAAENLKTVTEGSMQSGPNMMGDIANISGAVLIPLFAGNDQEGTFLLEISDMLLSTDMTPPPAEMAALINTPISLNIDVSMMIDLATSLLPTSLEDSQTPREPDGKITSVTLNDFSMSVPESSVQAQGALEVTGESFENSMPQTGQATVTVTGLTAFLDTLSENGLIPPNDRSMSEMMMRGFAKPGETDPLTYTIEMKGPNEMTINGNPF